MAKGSAFLTVWLAGAFPIVKRCFAQDDHFAGNLPQFNAKIEACEHESTQPDWPSSSKREDAKIIPHLVPLCFAERLIQGIHMIHRDTQGCHTPILFPRGNRQLDACTQICIL